MPIWNPEKEWLDQEVYLIGGGASLRGFNFSLLKGKNTIGCNAAFRLGPEVVKICLFGDSSWWEKVKEELEQFKGRVVTCSPTLLPLNIPWLLQIPREKKGLSGGGSVGWNFSTGAAAINLAILLGANKIYLMGYDLSSHTDGKTHWHDTYTRKMGEANFDRFQRGFSIVANNLGKFSSVKVVNVTDGTSKLNHFPRMSFQEVFPA